MRQVVLDEISELHKKYIELRKDGLYGIYLDCVSIALERFMDTFSEYEVQNFNVENYEFIYEVSAYNNGVKFTALVSPKEAEKYGIQIQEQDV